MAESSWITNVYLPTLSFLTSLPLAFLSVIVNASFFPTTPVSLGCVIAEAGTRNRTADTTATIKDESAIRIMELLRFRVYAPIREGAPPGFRFLGDLKRALHACGRMARHGAQVLQLAGLERDDELSALARLDQLALLARDLEVVGDRAFVHELERHRSVRND